MKFSSFVLATAAAAYTSAQEITRCGTSAPPAILDASFDLTEAKFALNRNDSRTVETYAHVVTTQQKEGVYMQTNVNGQVLYHHFTSVALSLTTFQIAAMNSAYGPSGFSFSLVSTTFTVNDAWAAAGQGSSAELAMKRKLHKGSYDTLNLYFLSDLGGGLLGFCYFPEEAPTANEKILDGCVNLAGSMPSVGELPNYDLGLTTVHETGHVSCRPTAEILYTSYNR